jgi:hypothetical protein
VTAAALSLRRRVALACLALGFLLSLLFAISVVVVAEDYEHVIAAEILSGQAEDYGLRIANGLPAQLPRTHRLSGYLRRDIPPRYAAYPPGISEDPAEDGVHVGVFDTSAGRMAFVIDLRDIEELEVHLNLMLAAIVVLGTALAGWLGWWFAGRAIAPVGRLAAAVDALPTTPRRTALRATTSSDELGRLAGAIEVLMDDLQPPAQEARLRRVERGMGELSDLLEAMLDVARRRSPRLEDVDAAAFLREAGAAALALSPGIVLDVHAAGAMRLAPREARLLLRGVLRRVLPYGVPGTLSLRLDGDALALSFDAADAESVADAVESLPAASRSDTGSVPALLDRLAQRSGWRIEFPQPRRARIVLQPAPSQIM